MNRRELRDHKYKLLFFIDNYDNSEIVKLLDFYFSNLPIEDEEDENTYVGNVSKYDYDSEIVKFTLKPYVEEIKDFLELFKQKKNDIDKIISDELIDWSIERLPKEELNLLRLAIFEMYYDKDLDMPIAINEAIMMSKIYGNSDKVSSFINGILSKLYNKNSKKLL